MAKRQAIGLVLLLLFGGGCARRLPPQEAQALWQSIQQARRTLVLQARLQTMLNMPQRRLEAEAQLHRGPGIIILQYVTGPFSGWRIIEQDGVVWRVSPTGQASPSLIRPEPGFGLRFREHLQITYKGPTRIAGRWAHRYIVAPREGRGGYLLMALDAQTYYPLLMRRYNAKGRLISQTICQQIRYDVSPPARQKPPAFASTPSPGKWALRQARPATERELEAALGGPLLKPAYLPAGMQLRGYFLRPLRWGLLAEMRYSDGLRTLLVAQMKRPARQGPATGNSGHLPRASAGEAKEIEKAEANAPRGRPLPPRLSKVDERPRGPLAPGLTATSPEQENVQRARNFLRARRGDRIVFVAGDLSPEELQRVLASIPYPSGQEPTLHF